jgi:DNA-binding TFAR19-related protein (PDSD5 family)
VDEEELGQLRNRKLQEQYAKMAKAQQLEEQMKAVLKHVLDGPAYERAMNVRLSNPELYQQLVSLLAYLYQNKQLKEKLGDEQLKNLLTRVASTKRETTISFKHK